MSWDKHRMNMPVYVGRWILSPNFGISVTKKPNWLQRKMVTTLFGWKWIDDEHS